MKVEGEGEVSNGSYDVWFELLEWERHGVGGNNLINSFWGCAGLEGYSRRDAL
jgi:hypothetical protein